MKMLRQNFLDYVPVRSCRMWEAKDGIVTMHIAHRGLWAAVAQRFFHRPGVSHIALDTYGSFLYCSIDGKKTVEELAQLLKNRFGGAVEPLYPRLVPYLRILRNNRLIAYRKRQIGGIRTAIKVAGGEGERCAAVLPDEAGNTKKEGM